MSINLGKVYVGNFLLLDGNGVANAVGSELNSATTYQDIITAIVNDKTILVNALEAFGVPASPTDSLVDLINLVIPLSVNYVTTFHDTFTSQSFSGNTDSVTTPLFFSFSPSPEPSDTFLDASFTPTLETGALYLGGDALNVTKSKAFVVLEVIDSTRLRIDSTSGMSFNDTLTQSTFTTSIVNILDGMTLLVGDTTGWVASTLATSF